MIFLVPKTAKTNGHFAQVCGDFTDEKNNRKQVLAKVPVTGN